MTSQPVEIRSICWAMNHIKSMPPTILSGVSRQLNATRGVMLLGFLKKKTVCPAKLKQAARRLISANKFEGLGELLSQHRLSGLVISIAIGVSAIEIVFRVVC